MPVGRASNFTLEYEPWLLTVWFSDGSGYEYFGVPPDSFLEFQNAASQGQYFNENIRGKYSENRLA